MPDETTTTTPSAGEQTNTSTNTNNNDFTADTAGATTINEGDGNFETTQTVEQLSWGDIKLSVSQDGILGLNKGLSTSVKLNTETNDDKEGRPATNTQTIELQEVSFDLSLNAYFLPKTTIEDEWGKWKKAVAKHYPLYINGKVFGPKEMQLIQVDLTDCNIDDWGRFITAKISVKLREYAPEKAKSKKTASTKSGKSKKSKGKTSTSGSKKSSAKNVGPSKSAKAAKKK